MFWVWLRLAAGIVLTVIGVLGLLLPVLPGWVFLLPGLVLLSAHFHWARRLLDYLRAHLDAGKGPGAAR